eukprot:snap_masked-scaffold_4-processed-gene-21.62-mRNA-1 protein AED:1.00 eAED:1.00 QI:0/-1/0/0/-1/1/1/0/88
MERMYVDQDGVYIYRLHVNKEVCFVVANARKHGEDSIVKKWIHYSGWTQQKELMLQNYLLAYGYVEWNAMMKGRYLLRKTGSQVVGKL